MLPSPGSPDFTPALFAALAADPSLLNWPLDGELLAAFLLAFIVRDGGIIIDVPSARRSSGILRSAHIAAAYLTSIFGLETHLLQLTAESMTSDVHVLGQAMVVTGLEDASPPVLIKVRQEMRRPEAPFLVWVRDEDRDDAPLWLLDLFACSAAIYEHELPPEGLTRNALIPPEYIDDLNAFLRLSHIHPPLELHISNLIAAAELHPQLIASISQTGSRTLTDMVRAHRLLSSPFTIPEGWRTSLKAWHTVHGNSSGIPPHGSHHQGFAGGPGGVSTWGERAGEAARAEAMLGTGAEDWFCTPENVNGALDLVIRHRLRVRDPGEGALCALDSTALKRTEHLRRDLTPRNKRDMARRKRAVIDEALEQMIRTV